MAKIGTAHIEIKPVISDDVLEAVTKRIADAVAEGVERGMAQGRARPIYGDIHINRGPAGAAPAGRRSQADAAVIANVIRERTKKYEGRGDRA